MPLRDHFRPPLDNKRHWESILAGWPMMIVALLRYKLLGRYLCRAVDPTGFPRRSADSGRIRGASLRRETP